MPLRKRPNGDLGSHLNFQHLADVLQLFLFELSMRQRGSLSDDFHQHAFPPAAVEFTVKNLFPRTEIESALGDRDDHFAPHDLALHVGVGIVFAGAIVTVL